MSLQQSPGVCSSLCGAVLRVPELREPNMPMCRNPGCPDPHCGRGRVQDAGRGRVRDAGCARCGMRKMRGRGRVQDAKAWACARCGGVRVCKMRDSLPPRSQLFHRSYSNKLIINIHTGMARCGGVGVCKMRAQLFHRSYSNKLIINIHTGMARCGGVGVCKMRGRARVQDAGAPVWLMTTPPTTDH